MVGDIPELPNLFRYGYDPTRFKSAITEAANRAEATALLLRCGFRVYRPEADIEGEDMVVRTPWRAEKPKGELLVSSLKAARR